MKKILVSMMLAVALAGGSSIYAQSQAEGNTGATSQKSQKEWNKGEKSRQKSDKKMKAQKPQFNPFEGVQLTDDQQQRLEVLQRGLGPVVLDKEQQEKIKENPNLTPEQKQQLKKERKAAKLEQKKQYLNGVKEILTPDQYVVFLENVYLYSPQGQGKSQWSKSNKDFKQGKEGKKGQKGHKGDRSSKPQQGQN